MTATQRFREGQEVAIRDDGGQRYKGPIDWRKATIVYSPAIFPPRYEVRFPDGTRAVFDAGHIRAITSPLKDAVPAATDAGMTPKQFRKLAESVADDLTK